MAKIEREVKLAAWGGFTLPALDDLAPDLTVEPLKTKKLDATYYDTRDLRLARAGVSLRHRVGDDPPWTVKLPDGESGPVMSRREIPFDGPAGTIPPEAAALVRAYARGEALVPVARLKTERSRVGLKIAGTPVAEIADDEVSVYHGRRLASRFREVEVEVEEEAPDKLLPAVVERLRDAGAGAPDKTPKVVRALGPRALEPLPGLVTAVGPDSTMGEVVRAAVGNALARIVAHDPGGGAEPDQPAADVLPPLVRRPWRRLAKAVRALPEVPADEDLHAVRILAKHTRYAAEAAAGVIGKRASVFAKQIAAVQTVLGDHQDACVTEGWLRQAAAKTRSIREAMLIGQLIGLQRAEAAAKRRDWPEVWARASDPARRGWLG